ncbi:MAG: hypothetical protein ACM3O7_07900 [Acidobacteriota bacterium]
MRRSLQHLWLAVKEGFVEHRRALLWLAAIVLCVVTVVQVTSYFVAYRSSVCGSCHIMDPYVKLWQASTHKDVACVNCHTEWRFLLSATYLRYAVGLYNVQLRAEVPDSRCLKCHEHQNLDTDKPFLKNIHFSHKGHLGEMRRGMQLHCTSCHTGIGVESSKTEHATHVSVQEQVCFTCHFKGAEKGKAVTGCLTCHGAPSKVVTHQGFQFDHSSYLKRDVRCDLCHVEVTRGDANVPKSRCTSCHVSRIEAYDDYARIHTIHLKEHEIDCRRCHNSIEHGKVAMAPALGERCENCHKPTHTPQEQMYIGIGGEGVPDTPSTMFLARVACDSCHGEPGGDPRRGAEQLRKSCVTCHGQGFDRMVDDWINGMGALQLDVNSVVQRAEAQARSLGDRGKVFQAELLRARHNVDFVRHARGEHNIRYAVELLRSARNDATDVLVKTGAGAPPPQPILASASGYCRVCHSTSHLGTAIEFAGMTYDHNRHIAAGLSCETCHSVEQHGKTIIAREQCMGCHHGSEQKRTCESCHPAQASLYKGQLLGTGVKGDPDVMAKAGVECASCHDLQDKDPVVKVVQKACVTCHEKGFDDMLVEWINDDQKNVQDLAVAIAKAGDRLQHESGQVAASHRQALAEAEHIQKALLAAKGAHNTSLSGDAYTQAKKLLAWAETP